MLPVFPGALARPQAQMLLDQLEACTSTDRAQIQFLLYQQKYLELLEAGAIRDALLTLRGQLTPLGIQRWAVLLCSFVYFGSR